MPLEWILSVSLGHRQYYYNIVYATDIGNIMIHTQRTFVSLPISITGETETSEL